MNNMLVGFAGGLRMKLDRAIETCNLMVSALKIKRELAKQEGKAGLEALFVTAILAIILVVFIMKMAPVMFSASSEAISATGAEAPDATSLTFMSMLPWVVIAGLAIAIIIVILTKIREK